MNLDFEKWYPLLSAAIACFAWDWFSISFPAETTPILSASLTLGAILSGFLATSQSILMGLKGEIRQELLKSGYMEDLSLYLSQGIKFSFTFALVSLVGFFTFPYVLHLVWLFLAVSSVLSFLRVTNISLKILTLQ